MFMTLLRFSDNRAAASEFMAAHNAWIAQGFDDGVFLCVGALAPAAGGAIIATGEARADHDARINADPFVIHDIVTAETHQIVPKRVTPALKFLMAQA